ncbi:hypothetical protein [Clostridium estertheticum]|uniref:hypothetical protein n=1 Tax=Clostridium estertheticum TaxID=238834 RepID=UPI001C6EE89C|nr:hypothetical protein [Clostridium estertheticum]MBW9154264.1 hypothetical protein [Clostridium estertheticum]WLC86691.1 hypothetical protein KTC97_21965 [Clostridium estertheticum]
MDIIEKDLELIKLEAKYGKLDESIGDIENEIESLEDEKSTIEYEMDEIEEKITRIKEKMLEVKIESLNFKTDDKFTNDFMKASYFTARGDSSRPALQAVNIKENELWALDGYRAIIITNNDIPKELQNTNINWDIREDFKENIINEKLALIDIKNIIPKKEEAKYIIPGVTPENFNNIFKTVEGKREKLATIKLYYEDFVIAAKGEFLNDALMVLKGKTFTIHFFSSVTPILITCENIEMIILPIRIIKGSI